MGVGGAVRCIPTAAAEGYAYFCLEMSILAFQLVFLLEGVVVLCESESHIVGIVAVLSRPLLYVT